MQTSTLFTASCSLLLLLPCVMQDAASLGQKVLVCCHLAFCPGSCPNSCLLWNYEDMLEVGTKQQQEQKRRLKHSSIAAASIGHLFV